MNKLLPFIVATGFAAGALAQGQPTPGQQPAPAPGRSATTFETLDRNGDQRISKAEAAADQMVNQNFAALDTDGDGAISMTEFANRSSVR